MHAENIGDRPSAADYGEIALIEIVKWRRLWTAVPSGSFANQLGRIRAALHSYLRHSWQRLALFINTGRQISYHEYFRIVWDGQVRGDLDMTGLVGLSPCALGE